MHRIKVSQHCMSTTFNQPVGLHLVQVQGCKELVLLATPSAMVHEEQLLVRICFVGECRHAPVVSAVRGAGSGRGAPGGGGGGGWRGMLVAKRLASIAWRGRKYSLLHGGVIVEHGRWAELRSHGSRPVIPVLCAGSLHCAVQIKQLPVPRSTRTVDRLNHRYA